MLVDTGRSLASTGSDCTSSQPHNAKRPGMTATHRSSDTGVVIGVVHSMMILYAFFTRGTDSGIIRAITSITTLARKLSVCQLCAVATYVYNVFFTMFTS